MIGSLLSSLSRNHQFGALQPCIRHMSRFLLVGLNHRKNKHMDGGSTHKKRFSKQWGASENLVQAS